MIIEAVVSVVVEVFQIVVDEVVIMVVLADQFAVKAVVVLKDAYRGEVSEQDIVAWAHANMAAYKSPRIVEFRDALPKSGSGKVMWREMQEEATAAAKN